MARYEIELQGDAVKELQWSLNQGPMDERGWFLMNEDVIDRINNLKIHVYSDEHPPPHFHVSVNGAGNAFQIKDCQPLYGTTLDKYFRNIRKWHEKNKHVLIDAWNNLRPADCPVGKYVEV